LGTKLRKNADMKAIFWRINAEWPQIKDRLEQRGILKKTKKAIWCGLVQELLPKTTQFLNSFGN